MIELLPCPFCGGEAYIEHDDDGSAYVEIDHRPDCYLTYKDTLRWFYPAKGDMSAEEHAASEWNRRAESACHMDLTETDTHEVTYRTWECDECGQSCEEVFGSYEYCPHCGRRVVNDGE